jgi:hypothetical protein
MSFGVNLRGFLEEYLPDWEILAEANRLARVSTTIRRWINEEHLPTPKALEEFLDGVQRHIENDRRKNFPQIKHDLLKSLEVLDKHKHKHHLDSYRFTEHMGEDAHHTLFNRWCSTSPKEITVYVTWVSYSPVFTEGMIKAVKAGAKTRILLVSPESSYLRDRLNPQDTDSINLYLAFLTNLDRLITTPTLSGANNFEVRFYRDYPLFRAYIVDNNILFTVNWPSGMVSEGPHLFISNDNVFSEYVRDTVNELWENNNNKSYSADLIKHYKQYIKDLGQSF